MSLALGLICRGGCALTQTCRVDCALALTCRGGYALALTCRGDCAVVCCLALFCHTMSSRLRSRPGERGLKVRILCHCTSIWLPVLQVLWTGPAARRAAGPSGPEGRSGPNTGPGGLCRAISADQEVSGSKPAGGRALHGD